MEEVLVRWVFSSNPPALIRGVTANTWQWVGLQDWGDVYDPAFEVFWDVLLIKTSMLLRRA